MSEWANANWPAVADLLPHRGGALLIDCVLAHDGRETLCRVDVAGQRWIPCSDGKIPSWLGIEYMAQCAAVHEGLVSWGTGAPPAKGVLVGVNDMRLYTEHFETSNMLLVRACRIRGRPALGVLSHACTIHRERAFREGDLLAEGRLSVAVSDGSAFKGHLI